MKNRHLRESVVLFPSIKQTNPSCGLVISPNDMAPGMILFDRVIDFQREIIGPSKSKAIPPRNKGLLAYKIGALPGVIALRSGVMGPYLELNRGPPCSQSFWLSAEEGSSCLKEPKKIAIGNPREPSKQQGFQICLEWRNVPQILGRCSPIQLGTSARWFSNNMWKMFFPWWLAPCVFEIGLKKHHPTWWLMNLSNSLVSWVTTILGDLSINLQGLSYSHNLTY